MGITEAEFISRLEKVMLIGKLAGGPQSAAVEEDKVPLAENAVPEENVEAVVNPEDEVDGKDEVPNEDLEAVNTDDLFGDDYDDGTEDESNAEDGEQTGVDGVSETDEENDRTNDKETEGSQEAPKEINENLPADELIKELANESKNDDEFFDMLLKRKTKFGLPTLIKAANIDMRNYILTGVESAVEPDTKSKRVALI